MFHQKKSLSVSCVTFASSLVVLFLTVQGNSHADGAQLEQENSRLSAQVKQLQAQLGQSNNGISNSANLQTTFRSTKTINPAKSDEIIKTRSANGHGR